MTLTDHPRLYLHADAQARLQTPVRLPALTETAEAVAAMADHYLRSPEVPWILNTHNAHLLRARNTQGRIVTLLVQWRRSGDDRYRAAVIKLLAEMGRWEYWSWIAWRSGDAAPDAIFDLSYGENCATLAIAWDWLHETLTAAERQLLLATARRGVDAYMHHSAPGDSRAWWYGKKDSNWNTVCAGGGGMLALAMYEELPEAEEMVARALDSIEPFVAEIREMRGAWPEGIGYWNYGMRYFYMFALSHEVATGRKSPWLRGSAITASLDFPLRFTPHPGIGCSFGDVNGWTPLPFHYAVAERLNRDQTLAELDLHLKPGGRGDGWPSAAELLCLHPGTKASPVKPTKPLRQHYRGQDWVVLADQSPHPTLYASIRGGTTEVPHGHLDLTSFHAVVGDERTITNLGPTCYLDTTFSARRWELFEMAPGSKNVMLVNGAGIQKPATVTTRSFDTVWGPAVRLDAASAMGESRSGEPTADSYYRLFLLLPDRGLLVLDTIKTPHPALFEQRLFTPMTADAMKTGVRLKGQKQRARLSFASSEDAFVATCQAPMTRPTPGTPPPTMLRWQTRLLHEQVCMATYLTPGTARARVHLVTDAKGVAVTLESRHETLTLSFTPSLNLRD